MVYTNAQGHKVFFLVFTFLFVLSFSFLHAQTDSVSQQNIGKKKAAVVFDTLKTDSSVAAKNQNDSTTAKKKLKRHSPLKAALFSMAVPGLGQGYNKKYWKIPIVYAGFAGLGYAVYYTTSEFYGYRSAYRLQLRGDKTASYRGVDDEATLKVYRDYYKRYVDISAICTSVWYALNIIDATVDAHLFEWNMKDDLSVSWRPVMMEQNNFTPSAYSGGVKISLRF